MIKRECNSPPPPRKANNEFDGCLRYPIVGWGFTLTFEGKMEVARLIWPLRTRVKHWRSNVVGLPKWKVRVTSVVPSLYWPPESHRYISRSVMGRSVSGVGL